MLACLKFPISYGTADAGENVRFNLIVHQMLLKLSKTLNLAPHQVVQGATMAMCVDLEIHKVRDQYIVLGMKPSVAINFPSFSDFAILVC